MVGVECEGVLEVGYGVDRALGEEERKGKVGAPGGVVGFQLDSLFQMINGAMEQSVAREEYAEQLMRSRVGWLVLEDAPGEEVSEAELAPGKAKGNGTKGGVGVPHKRGQSRLTEFFLAEGGEEPKQEAGRGAQQKLECDPEDVGAPNPDRCWGGSLLLLGPQPVSHGIPKKLFSGLIRDQDCPGPIRLSGPEQRRP